MLTPPSLYPSGIERQGGPVASTQPSQGLLPSRPKIHVAEGRFDASKEVLSALKKCEEKGLLMYREIGDSVSVSVSKTSDNNDSRISKFYKYGLITNSTANPLGVLLYILYSSGDAKKTSVNTPQEKSSLTVDMDKHWVQFEPVRDVVLRVIEKSRHGGHEVLPVLPLMNSSYTETTFRIVSALNSETSSVVSETPEHCLISDVLNNHRSFGRPPMQRTTYITGKEQTPDAIFDDEQFSTVVVEVSRSSALRTLSKRQISVDLFKTANNLVVLQYESIIVSDEVLSQDDFIRIPLKSICHMCVASGPTELKGKNCICSAVLRRAAKVLGTMSVGRGKTTGDNVVTYRLGRMGLELSLDEAVEPQQDNIDPTAQAVRSIYSAVLSCVDWLITEGSGRVSSVIPSSAEVCSAIMNLLGNPSQLKLFDMASLKDGKSFKTANDELSAHIITLSQFVLSLGKQLDKSCVPKSQGEEIIVKRGASRMLGSPSDMDSVPPPTRIGDVYEDHKSTSDCRPLNSGAVIQPWFLTRECDLTDLSIVQAIMLTMAWMQEVEELLLDPDLSEHSDALLATTQVGGVRDALSLIQMFSELSSYMKTDVSETLREKKPTSRSFREDLIAFIRTDEFFLSDNCVVKSEKGKVLDKALIGSCPQVQIECVDHLITLCCQIRKIPDQWKIRLDRYYKSQNLHLEINTANLPPVVLNELNQLTKNARFGISMTNSEVCNFAAQIKRAMGEGAFDSSAFEQIEELRRALNKTRQLRERVFMPSGKKNQIDPDSLFDPLETKNEAVKPRLFFLPGKMGTNETDSNRQVYASEIMADAAVTMKMIGEQLLAEKGTNVAQDASSLIGEYVSAACASIQFVGGLPNFTRMCWCKGPTGQYGLVSNGRERKTLVTFKFTDDVSDSTKWQVSVPVPEFVRIAFNIPQTHMTVSRMHTVNSELVANTVTASLRYDAAVANLAAQSVKLSNPDLICAAVAVSQFSRSSTDAFDMLYNVVKNSTSDLSEMVNDMTSSMEDFRHSAHFMLIAELTMEMLRVNFVHKRVERESRVNDYFAIGKPQTRTHASHDQILFSRWSPFYHHQMGVQTTVMYQLASSVEKAAYHSNEHLSELFDDLSSLLKDDDDQGSSEDILHIFNQTFMERIDIAVLGFYAALGTITGGKVRLTKTLNSGTNKKFIEEQAARFMRDYGRDQVMRISNQQQLLTSKYAKGLFESLLSLKFKHCSTPLTVEMSRLASPVKISNYNILTSLCKSMAARAITKLGSGSILCGPSCSHWSVTRGTGGQISYIIDDLTSFSRLVKEMGNMNVMHESSHKDKLTFEAMWEPRVWHLYTLCQIWQTACQLLNKPGNTERDVLITLIERTCGFIQPPDVDIVASRCTDAWCTGCLFSGLHNAWWCEDYHERKTLGSLGSHLMLNLKSAKRIFNTLNGLLSVRVFASCKVQRIGYRMIYTMSLGGLFTNQDTVITEAVRRQYGSRLNIELVSEGGKAASTIEKIMNSLLSCSVDPSKHPYTLVNRTSNKLTLFDLHMYSIGSKFAGLMASKLQIVPESFMLSRVDHSAFSPADYPTTNLIINEEKPTFYHEIFRIMETSRLVTGIPDFMRFSGKGPMFPHLGSVRSSKGNCPILPIAASWEQGYITVPSSLSVLSSKLTTHSAAAILGVISMTVQNSDDQMNMSSVVETYDEQTRDLLKLHGAEKMMNGPVVRRRIADILGISERIFSMGIQLTAHQFSSRFDGRAPSSKKGGLGGNISEIIYTMGLVTVTGGIPNAVVARPPELSSLSAPLTQEITNAIGMALRFNTRVASQFQQGVQPSSQRTFNRHIQFLDSCGLREVWLDFCEQLTGLQGNDAEKNLNAILGAPNCRRFFPTRYGGTYPMWQLHPDAEMAEMMFVWLYKTDDRDGKPAGSALAWSVFKFAARMLNEDMRQVSIKEFERPFNSRKFQMLGRSITGIGGMRPAFNWDQAPDRRPENIAKNFVKQCRNSTHKMMTGVMRKKLSTPDMEQKGHWPTMSDEKALEINDNRNKFLHLLKTKITESLSVFVMQSENRLAIPNKVRQATDLIESQSSHVRMSGQQINRLGDCMEEQVEVDKMSRLASKLALFLPDTGHQSYTSMEIASSLSFGRLFMVSDDVWTLGERTLSSRLAFYYPEGTHPDIRNLLSSDTTYTVEKKDRNIVLFINPVHLQVGIPENNELSVPDIVGCRLMLDGSGQETYTAKAEVARMLLGSYVDHAVAREINSSSWSPTYTWLLGKETRVGCRLWRKEDGSHTGSSTQASTHASIGGTKVTAVQALSTFGRRVENKSKEAHVVHLFSVIRHLSNNADHKTIITTGLKPDPSQEPGKNRSCVTIASFIFDLRTITPRMTGFKLFGFSAFGVYQNHLMQATSVQVDFTVKISDQHIGFEKGSSDALFSSVVFGTVKRDKSIEKQTDDVLRSLELTALRQMEPRSHFEIVETGSYRFKSRSLPVDVLLDAAQTVTRRDSPEKVRNPYLAVASEVGPWLWLSGKHNGEGSQPRIIFRGFSRCECSDPEITMVIRQLRPMPTFGLLNRNTGTQETLT